MKNIDLLKYAINHHVYATQLMTYDEFVKDYKLPSILNKYFNKYHTQKIIKKQKISNMLIMFFNVFDEDAAAFLLLTNIRPHYLLYLKTFILFLYRSQRLDIDIEIFMSTGEIDHELLNILYAEGS